MPDFVAARDAMIERVYDHWQTNALLIVGSYLPELRLPRIVYRNPIDRSKHWGRLSLQSVESNQAAFAEYGSGKKKYVETGLVFIQLFAPKSDVNSGEIQDKLAKEMRSCFRGISLPGKVWFRRARINDLADEDEMLRLNVVADYEYNEIA